MEILRENLIKSDRMAKIALLPETLIDQIAAGEVLENPASAVKELVENALDAGAKEIRIAIEGGGLQRIEIEDDGCGMDAEDLGLCLLRHATSKIRSLEDLERIGTKGFRGEALAAIASVSKLEIRTSDGIGAWRFVGGEITPCARRRGTTVEIRALFQNTPARLKFQKSPATCAAAILKVVEILSLAHSDVRFYLSSNGKEVLKLAPKGWQERALEVMGPLHHEMKGIRGLVGRPDEGKKNRSGQVLFVNGRPVISNLIAKAVKEGFGTRMEEKLFPSFLLFLELPLEQVDVNVHPQKREVRFLEESRIFEWVRRSVDQAFAQSMPDLAPLPWEFSSSSKKSESLPFVAAESSFFETQSLPIEAAFRILGCMDDLMLVEEDGWTLIDLRGALARILFEEMGKKTIVGEPLLIPFSIQVENAEETAVKIADLGIEARPVSRRELGIYSLPFGIEVGEVECLVNEWSERGIAAALTKSVRNSRRSFREEERIEIWKRLRTCKEPQHDPLGRKIWARVTKEELRRLF